MQLVLGRDKLAPMNTTTRFPVLYCPRCRKGAEATLDSELACPRCGGQRQLLKFGAMRPQMDGAAVPYERPASVDEILEEARMHSAR